MHEAPTSTAAPPRRSQFQYTHGGQDFPFSFSSRRLTLGMSRCRKRERGTSGRWRQSAPCPCWAAPIDASLVSDLRSPIGIVDQDRRTRTDVELRRQQNIGGKTPLDEFFAGAALAQRVVQLRLHGPK